jgi:CheY-like chemotaxis protein
MSSYVLADAKGAARTYWMNGPVFTRRKVLIIDNDVAVVDALSELLDTEGFEVTTAMDGQAALDLLRRCPLPCVILLDLMMPGMDGWDFRQAQLNDKDLSTIPLVIMAAAGFSESSVRGSSVVTSNSCQSRFT